MVQTERSETTKEGFLFEIVPYLSLAFKCNANGARLGTLALVLIKVKGGNLERQVIWNRPKSHANHKLYPLFLVCIISMKGEFGSSKNG